MKVIKAEDVATVEAPQTETTNQQPDPAKIAEAQENFDRTRQLLETKNYGVALNAEQTKFLFEDFFNLIMWKGYESYAVSESYSRLESLVKDGTLNGGTQVEIIEAIFHFLKNHVGTGVKSADLFKQVCDQFAIPMKEINEDRQTLRDLSLELLAAEQGISVEKALEEIQRTQAMQGR
jgi:hypothetical protein